MKHLFFLFLPFLLFSSDISVQVLGSGGPEGGERASASYLIKQDEKALVLIDFGGGALLRFGQAKADIEDLRVILLTHLHIDHVVELPALMKAGYFSDRTESLAILGPQGNDYFPGLKEYIDLQFGKNGAYRYMSDILGEKSESFSIIPYEIGKKKEFNFKPIKVTALRMHHGIVPALAYKIEIEGKIIVFSGDTTAQTQGLEELSMGADILIAHHAIPQEGYLNARKLHMTPKRIAEVSSVSKPKTVLLSHRMIRTYGTEEQSNEIIRKVYAGKIIWAEDLMEIEIP